jgi:hypothetical protein
MSWQELKQKVEGAIKDLAVLDIQTVVTKADDPSKSIIALETRIDEVTGDITNTLSEAVFAVDYGERLLAFHAAQRADGIAILERNAKLIRELLELIRENT